MLNKFLIAAATLALGANAAAASSDGSCTKTTKDQWLTTQQLTEKLTAQGYKVSEIELDDSCAEAKVSKDGKRAELYLDPATGAVTEQESED